MATEEPTFKVIQKSGALEVREYPPLIAAEVLVGGDRSQAVNAGFRLLAGYIFGGNTRRRSIAMTAPVVQAPARGESIAMTAPVVQTGANGAWTVRFLMPKSYTLDTLPTPNDQRVHLLPLAAARGRGPLLRTGPRTGHPAEDHRAEGLPRGPAAGGHPDPGPVSSIQVIRPPTNRAAR